MKRKNLLLTVAAAAVLGAFNPAFAGGGAKHGSSADSSYPSTEQSASGSGASSGADDMNVRGGVSVDRETGDTQRGAGAEQSASSEDMTRGGDIGPQASADRSQDVDPRTGLDRGHPAN
jgi:hypothetical protein